MSSYSPISIEYNQVRVFPLKTRKSLLDLKQILVEPSDPPPHVSEITYNLIDECAEKILNARAKGAGVLIFYGAHLIKNGGQLILKRLIDFQWVTHLATNGAGMIHDWEFAFLGKSGENVRENVKNGCFGTWDETGKYLTFATLIGQLGNEGIGTAVGRFIHQDGFTVPDPEELEFEIQKEPANPITPCKSELLRFIRAGYLKPGHNLIVHPYRNASVLAHAFHSGVPLTVHPGIGYDIIITHPLYSGIAFGKGAEIDFRKLIGTVSTLEDGVVLNIGTAIMGPQVFEKSLSCVNNIRLNKGKGPIKGHWIYVVDIQDAGGWDWTQGEPPPSNPAYYLRFCKSFSRMGGAMKYVQCDNIAFLHNLLHKLAAKSGRPIKTEYESFTNIKENHR